MAKTEGEGRLLSIPLAPHGGEEFPADVDIEPSGDRYVGYYENQHGEQLIFVFEKGGKPLLYHGDYGWEPLVAEWPRIVGPLSSWATGNLILDQAEVLWLASCLAASGALSEDSSDGAGPLDRLTQALDQHGSEHFARQWSLRAAALERWQEMQRKPPSHEEVHYAEGAILVALGLDVTQRQPRPGVTKKIRERIEREAAEAARLVRQSRASL